MCGSGLAKDHLVQGEKRLYILLLGLHFLIYLLVPLIIKNVKAVEWSPKCFNLSGREDQQK